MCVSGRKWGDMVATRPESLPVLKGLIACIMVIHKLLHRLPQAPISQIDGSHSSFLVVMLPITSVCIALTPCLILRQGRLGYVKVPE